MRRAWLLGLLLLLGAPAWAQTTYYVDPNVSSSGNTGTAAAPWKGISQISWTTVNTALASGAVTIYLSATPASHVANTVDTTALSISRTDTSTHLLTIDGASLYNNNDTSPSSSTWVTNSTLAPAGCVAGTQYRCAATASWATGFQYQIGTSAGGVSLPISSNATYSNCIGYITIQGFHAYRSEGQAATLNYIHDLTLQYNQIQGIPNVPGSYGPGVYAGPGNNGPCQTSTPLASGTVNTSGTAVTWVSGTQFTSGSAWVGTKTITINGTQYNISSVSSATAMVLSASAGTQSGVAYSVPQFSGPDNVTIQYNYIHDTYEDLMYLGASTSDPPGGPGNAEYEGSISGHGLTCGTTCPTGANYLIQFNTLENSATPGGGENQCIDTKDGHIGITEQYNTCRPSLLFASTSVTGVTGTEASTTVTLTDSAGWPVPFHSGLEVYVSGCSVSGYNGVQSTAVTVSGTSLTYTVGSSGLGATTGCTVIPLPPGGPGFNSESCGTDFGNFFDGPATQGIGLHTSWNNSDGRSACTIENNMIVNAHWSQVGDNSGVHIWNDSTGQFWSNVSLYNNTFYSDNVGYGGACITADSGSYTGTMTLQNSIINTCGAGGTSGTITAHSYNSYYNTGASCPSETGVQCGNPLFDSTATPYVDTGFELQSGSPVIGVGTNLHSLFNTDYFGNALPSSGAWTMGAAQQATTSYTLTAAVIGSGTMTSSPSGISCPPTCSASFTSGTVVTMSQSPSTGNSFAGWSTACSGTGSCSVTMSAAESVGATFTQNSPTLPAIWVDNNEATDGLVYTPPRYELALGVSGGTWISPVPVGCTFTLANYVTTFTGLQDAVNDIEACRTATGVGIIVDIPPGLYTHAAATGLVIPQTASALATNFLVLRSTQDGSLPNGQTVCSHGIQDNLATSTDIGLDNPDCAGDVMYYQLGTTQTTISPGAFTLANGKATNTSAYDDVQYMWTAECSGTNCSAFITCSPIGSGGTPACGSTTIAPDHWLIEDMEARPSVGNTTSTTPINMSEVGSETSLTQLPTHIHLRKVWAHGDWTSLATGANSIVNAIQLGCVYCSLVDSQISQILRPGNEGHGIGLRWSVEHKINHNWIEGASSGLFSGGYATVPTIPGLVMAQDEEWRRNRFTFPYAWLGQDDTSCGTHGVGTIPSSNPSWGCTSSSGNSIERKNAQEFKEGERVLADGNIYENVDNSGGQSGVIHVETVRDCSGTSSACANYQDQIVDITDTNNIYRNGCEGMVFDDGGPIPGTNGGGVSPLLQRISITNSLLYNITTTNPGCGASASAGIYTSSELFQWEGTITENSAGTAATFTATCSVDGGDCPAGPPSVGYAEFALSPGDPVSIKGCTVVTAFNVPTHTVGGQTVPVNVGPGAAAGTLPSALTVTYPWVATAGATDTSGNCILTKGEGGPLAWQMSHVSFITDSTHALTAANTPSIGPNFGLYDLVQNDITLGSGWYNNPVGVGTPTEDFDHDANSLTGDHAVWPTQTSSSYTAYGNNPSFPQGSPVLYFPATPYCTGATSTSACVGFIGAMSTSSMPLVLSDFHQYELRSDSVFYAGGSQDASDGTSQGPNIPAIDSAMNLNLYACPYSCGSPGPYPDTVSTTTPSLPRQLNGTYLANSPLPIGTNNTHYVAVLAQNNIRLTGQTVECGGGTNGSTPCRFDTETATGVACAPTISFANFDSIVADYTLTNLLLAGVTEGGTNQYVAQCVFSQAQANASALTWVASTGYLASDYILASGNYWQSQTICSNSTYDSTCVSGSTLPTCFASSTSPCADGQINWIKLGTNAPLLDVFCGPNYKCGPSGSSCYDVTAAAVVFNASSIPVGCTTTQLYEGEIITSELPFRNWFINSVIPAVIAHYNGMSGFGYLRVGCTGSGECNPIGIGSGLYPYYQSTPGCMTTPCAAQQRATYLSYVKILYTAIKAFNPQMTLLGDMTCPGGDCLYADQLAYLAYSLNFSGISTNALDVNDVQNVLGTGSTPCAIPPVANSGCTTGDFFYNFYTYSTNAAGSPFWHGLQTDTGSTPLDCLPGATGPLFTQPAGLPNCSLGFIGLLPFLNVLQFVGVGSPNTKIYVNNLELYVNPPASGTSPTVPAGDVLLALDPNYLTTTGAQSTYFPYQAAQAAAFYRWLFPFNPPLSRNFGVAKNQIEDWPSVQKGLRFSESWVPGGQ